MCVGGGGGVRRVCGVCGWVRGVGVCPSVQAEGLDMTIPMPGHPPANANAEAATKQVCWG